ncbi:ATP synthase I chain [Candidatus Electrothrix gigas]|jgi:hypothetical protein
MTDTDTQHKQNKDLILVRTVEWYSLLLLAFLTGSSWYWLDWPFARSVLIGGVLSIGNFFWMKQTATRLLQKVATQADGHHDVKQLKSKALSSGFAVKFYVRLFILAFVLILLNTQFSLHVIGIAVGLSTVMLSVMIVVLLHGGE